MLDNTPLATPTFIAGIILALVAYLNHDVSAFQALVAGGIAGLGSGAIGHARNGSGRGIRSN